VDESIDLITLTIAVLAFALAVATLWWQVASYKLSGGRIKAENIRGLADIHGAQMMTIEPGSLPPESIRQLKADGYSLDVAGVTVRNIGRMPVSITRVQAVIRPTGVIYDPMNSALGKQLPHRLEAGESEHWAFNTAVLRQAASAQREDGTRGTSYVINVHLGDGKKVVTSPVPIPPDEAVSRRTGR
jgi:hypothetical protein